MATIHMYEEGTTLGVVRVAEWVDQERLAVGEKMGSEGMRLKEIKAYLEC